MKLLFAQGNPGAQYERTRHNVGFMVLDYLANKAGASWRTDTKFKAAITDITIEGEKVLLVKPLSFYNDTGLVARALVDFYKLTPALDVLAIHDDLALPFGTIRVREKGTDAGNNGVKSLNTHLGPNYSRIRIGIWNERRNQMDDAHFVLSAFSADELAALKQLFETPILPLITSFVEGTLEVTSYSAAP